MTSKIKIRHASRDDLEQIITIDTQISGVSKPDYWQDAFKQYNNKPSGYFLVAEADRQIRGFVLGEVRAWEFGSPPCGWVFGLNVLPDERLHGTGTLLLDTLCAYFQEAGVNIVRTMVRRQNRELLAFFRSQAMMAGPYLELEKEL